MQEVIAEIKIDQIRVSPFQPRKHIDEEAMKELASSIASVGLIHPPVVRAVHAGSKLLYYELIAGERRWRAIQSLKWPTIKVIVREIDDTQAARAALIENVQRVDLSPLEMAESFQKLITTFQMTQEEVAEKVGKKRSTVANYLRLLTLPPEVASSLSSGQITMGHAKAILSLDDPELKEQLHEMIKTDHMTVRDTEKKSATLQKNPKKKPRATALPLHLEELEQKLESHFGTKVKIEMQKNKEGRLILHYFGVEDLERLAQLLGTSV